MVTETWPIFWPMFGGVYVAAWKARYSGPECSGTCKCGHRWDRHHLGIVMNQNYAETTKEGYVPQECEFYGCNEAGGLRLNDETGEWEEHCSYYEDAGFLPFECVTGEADV